jgi:hypothetical protein
MKGNDLYVSQIGWISSGFRSNYQVMDFGNGELARIRVAGSMSIRKMMNE